MSFLKSDTSGCQTACSIRAEYNRCICESNFTMDFNLIYQKSVAYTVAKPTWILGVGEL